MVAAEGKMTNGHPRSCTRRAPLMKSPDEDLLPLAANGSIPQSVEPADSAIRGPEMLLLLMLASVQFTSIVDFMVVMPLGPQLKRVLVITSSQFGLIVSSYTISA